MRFITQKQKKKQKPCKPDDTQRQKITNSGEHVAWPLWKTL